MNIKETENIYFLTSQNWKYSLMINLAQLDLGTRWIILKSRDYPVDYILTYLQRQDDVLIALQLCLFNDLRLMPATIWHQLTSDVFGMML